MRREPPGVAVARRLDAAWLARIDQGHTVTVAQCFDGADHPDGPGSYDSNVAKRTFCHDLAGAAAQPSLFALVQVCPPQNMPPKAHPCTRNVSGLFSASLSRHG